MCSKSFRRDNLKRHVDSVHEKQRIVCMNCGVACSTQSALKRHLLLSCKSTSVPIVENCKIQSIGDLVIWRENVCFSYCFPSSIYSRFDHKWACSKQSDFFSRCSDFFNWKLFTAWNCCTSYCVFTGHRFSRACRNTEGWDSIASRRQYQWNVTNSTN